MISTCGPANGALAAAPAGAGSSVLAGARSWALAGAAIAKEIIVPAIRYLSIPPLPILLFAPREEFGEGRMNASYTPVLSSTDIPGGRHFLQFLICIKPTFVTSDVLLKRP